MKRCLLFCLAGVLLLSLLPMRSIAAEPLKIINVKVDRTSVKVGDTITVTWEVTGGTPPYDCFQTWNAVAYVDVPQEFSGTRGSGSMTVKANMEPVITFQISARDARGSAHEVSVDSNGLGLDITNQDGWRWPGTHGLVRQREYIRPGEAASVTVYSKYSTGWGTWWGFSYRWCTVYEGPRGREYTAYEDCYGGDPVVVLLHMPGDAAVGGYLEVNTNPYDHPDLGEPMIYCSDTYLIQDGPPLLPGDADGDGAVNMADLKCVIDYLVNRKACKSMDNANADGVGEVDVLDALWLVERLVI